MQLGSILTGSPGEPCATREVEFHIMRMSGTGRQRHRVKAVFLPVSEADRLAARRDAVAYLRSQREYAEKDGMLPPIPPSVIDQEAVYKFFAYALHDVEDHIKKFIGAQDYQLFRDGIIGEQVALLNRAYNSYIEQEYPELSVPDMTDLEDQAVKK